jgi:hypothetical protein
MEGLRRYYREVWCLDFEFYAPTGERPLPLCLAARELFSRRLRTYWLQDLAPAPCPWSVGADVLLVAFYASAEMGCCLALDWPFPVRLLDLYVEFRNVMSGRPVPCGYGLLGALTAFGIEGLAAVEKADMRRLAMQGPPYTPAERDALLAYCQTDVDALAQLLPAMLPHLDLPRALLRGRYMCAAARMEWTATPLDVETLTALQAQWDVIRQRIAQEVNRTCGVFVPTGITLDPDSHLGAAISRAAAHRNLDPYHLAVAVAHVWHEARAVSAETLDARRTARTFVPNGNLGTDHAWGSHHIVMGGAVRGSDFYGVPGSNGTVFPTLAPAGPDDTDEDSGARGRSIPMVAVDQDGATLAAWFGLGDPDLAAGLPHLGRFSSPTLGFLGEGDTGTLGFFEYLLVHQFDTRPNTVPIPPERVFGHTLFVLRG